MFLITVPMWQQLWRYVVLTFMRPVFKWFLHKVTGKCELQRILSSNECGARRALKIGMYVVKNNRLTFQLPLTFSGMAVYLNIIVVTVEFRTINLVSSQALRL